MHRLGHTIFRQDRLLLCTWLGLFLCLFPKVDPEIAFKKLSLLFILFLMILVCSESEVTQKSFGLLIVRTGMFSEEYSHPYTKL